MSRHAFSDRQLAEFEVVGPWGAVRVETASGAVLSYEPGEAAGEYDGLRSIDVRELREAFPDRAFRSFDIAECGWWDDDGVFHPPVARAGCGA